MPLRHRGINRDEKSWFFAFIFALCLCSSVARVMTIPSNWFEDFFYGLALDLWRKAVPPEHTKAEADFIAEALQCYAGAHLLDVPCGNGRLSFELAGRGYRVTGIDISKEFINEAQQRIATQSGAVEFHLGDMRK